MNFIMLLNIYTIQLPHYTINQHIKIEYIQPHNREKNLMHFPISKYQVKIKILHNFHSLPLPLIQFIVLLCQVK